MCDLSNAPSGVSGSSDMNKCERDVNGSLSLGLYPLSFTLISEAILGIPQIIGLLDFYFI